MLLTSRIILTLFFVNSAVSVLAQFPLQGRVTDRVNGKPLAYVVVSDMRHFTGDVTGEDGRFELTVHELPAILEFRLLGYESERIEVKENQFLEIKLSESIVELHTVEIRPSELEHVAGDEKRSVWDYAWSGDHLVVCDYGNSLKSATLILWDEKLVSLDTVTAPDLPVDLFTDCLGNAQLQGKDSTWQIITTDNRISFLSGEDNYLVDNVLRHCKCADERRLYFEFPQGRKQFDDGRESTFIFETRNDEIHYFYGNRDEPHMACFTTITDRRSQELKQEELSRDKRMRSRLHGGSDAGNAASKVFFYRTLLKEIYAPLFLIDSSLYILDHINERVVRFDTSMSVVSVDTMFYAADPAFTRNCFTDEEKNNVFACFEKNGTCAIRKVDLETALLTDQWILPHAFPEAITVRSGYIYYIHRDERNHTNRFLSRMAME